MITTDAVPGSPCWLDLGAPDPDTAAAFYGAVFGWEFRPMAEGGDGGYGEFRLDGGAVGGMGRLTEPGARSAWTLYYSVPGVEKTVADAERLGGTVRVPPAEMAGAGRMAQLTDPQGGEFAVWEPGTFTGVEVADVPGSLCWTELYTTNAVDARAFYGALFGWTSTDMAMPGGGVYSMVTPSGQGDERMFGGIMELPSEYLALAGGRPYWHPVFAVTDCDAAVARVTGNGGSVQMGPEDAEGVGRLAVCVDQAGADFVVLTPAGQG
ncbi:VOC family protein [Streptomyces sp. TRM 70351]|uniref:VOC family protein n=1 Tax=Streptomyces sp. TRM 70351 TaxID=3116552 RepID=UPI002E7AD72D|nr:VOC family protein [Streptomyces sp. TRM 70351]MEE1930318.1 VOC family protein [Streptomyces sp. TRM 70351]